MQDSTTAPDVALNHEAVQPDAVEDGNDDPNVDSHDSQAGSESEDSESNCSKNDLTAAMYESDQGDSDMEYYEF